MNLVSIPRNSRVLVDANIILYAIQPRNVVILAAVTRARSAISRPLPRLHTGGSTGS
jgi:hypothetical protein